MLRAECTREMNDCNPALPHSTPWQNWKKTSPFCALCKWFRILAMTLETAAKIGQNQDSFGMLKKLRDITIHKE